jgi:RsiW-degrading membrane proteinase PrsW (M82 family)
VCFTNLLAILPIAFWVFLFLRRDKNNPEPAKWLRGCFIAGMIIAPIIIGYETLLINGSPYFTNLSVLNFRLIMVFGGAIIEELAKFFIIYLILRYNPHFDEPMDAVIYLVMGAAGFALVENVMVSTGLILEMADVFTSIGVLFGRFLGANLIHVVIAAVIGFTWGYLAKEKIGIGRKKQGIFWALVLGISIHTLFNFLVFTYGETARILASLGLIIIFAIVFLSLNKLDIKNSLFFKSKLIEN